jgi:hypothetical protein
MRTVPAKMMVVMVVMLLTTMGCVPAYLVRPSEIQQEEVPALREHDGRPVTLQGGSFAVTGDPPLADGRLRVRGPGRHSKTWLAGLAITSIGIGLGITALACVILAASPAGYSGNASEGTGFTTATGRALDYTALVLGSTGVLAGGVAGPSVWIAGARQAPIELRF